MWYVRESTNGSRVLVGKPNGKRSLGRSRQRRRILEWIVEKEFAWLKTGERGGLL